MAIPAVIIIIKIIMMIISILVNMIMMVMISIIMPRMKRRMVKLKIYLAAVWKGVSPYWGRKRESFTRIAWQANNMCVHYFNVDFFNRSALEGNMCVDFHLSLKRNPQFWPKFLQFVTDASWLMCEQSEAKV